ncbi:response regulator transcription factor [Desulfosporosinus metallidurans]|uniref:Stage 0 sporulation protein A homolog n=1 Tax=Desulfosporosinus metallidurans TaxID=1888891 RepID=A0A1Q8R085_9FIRM|nr:response regulator [Desulfosporosinus metallidurans]OLN33014.1 Phosphate regulon transcriptional regulatory protein PhoB (SphR) [Desulfosporosinus metallidurans]
MEGKIVLVDDDPAILELVRDYLVQEGFDVLTASIGMDGLKLIKNQAPKLILLDWMLPDVSGLEICKYVRKSSSIPIIMLTGRSGEADRIMALDAGVDDYLVKPFNLLELGARIRSVLRRFPKEAIRY